LLNALISPSACLWERSALFFKVAAVHGHLCAHLAACKATPHWFKQDSHWCCKAPRAGIQTGMGLIAGCWPSEPAAVEECLLRCHTRQQNQGGGDADSPPGLPRWQGRPAPQMLVTFELQCLMSHCCSVQTVLVPSR
jgi:hypothetical protein